MKNCKHCGEQLIIRQTQQKASQLRQPYYYTSYYICPKCGRMYHDDKFKIFNKDFLQTIGVSSTQQNHVLDNVDVEIWTDGACTNNGNSLAKAAWAFVSGKYEEAGLVEGKQTNNIAEALAIYHALVWASKQGYRNIRIHSDSQITINNLQKNIQAIKANKEIFSQIFTTISNNKLNVQYQKVAGHSGDINNERVDKLANGLVS